MKSLRESFKLWNYLAVTWSLLKFVTLFAFLLRLLLPFQYCVIWVIEDVIYKSIGGCKWQYIEPSPLKSDEFSNDLDFLVAFSNGQWESHPYQRHYKGIEQTIVIGEISFIFQWCQSNIQESDFGLNHIDVSLNLQLFPDFHSQVSVAL